MASLPPSPPLVWVTQGKNQHAAYLLETREEENKCLIRWNSTNKTALVSQESVARALTPRRQKSPILDDASISDNENVENESMAIDEEICVSRRAAKRLAPPQSACEENDKDDDSVQVLLTIMPPTPKRPKQKTSDESKRKEARRVSTSPAAKNELQDALQKEGCSNGFAHDKELKSQAAMPQGAVEETDDSVMELKPAAIPQRASEPTYTFRSSAYVQNLSEICFTILNDARWRVEGRAQKPLFSWEQGEDLSAVRMLSKLFDPPVRKSASKCRCILCREEKAECEEERTDETQDNDTTLSPHESLPPENDEEITRALYLYSRLYYRKGPWFRFDNIFKYYAPEDSSSSEEADTEDERRGMDTILRERRNSFFGRSSSSLSIDQSQSNKNHNNKIDMIDQAVLQDRISDVTLMLRDVERLYAMGLVRSFHNEEECGKTVGAITPEGNGILTAKERQSIVDKLGGRVKKEKNQKQKRENIVWNQMRKQRSISFNIPGDKKGTSALLPVCRHVDELLLEKLATRIVLASSRVDYLPASVRKPAVAHVKDRILRLRQAGSTGNSMCLTLRESPLLCLRRCSRLYLCASSGPGDMRGDDTNAWRSLRDINIATIPQDIPLPTVVQPPGSYSWHRVLHPPLSHRFGITSFAFIDAHEFLSCENSERLAEGTNLEQSVNPATQVFENVDAFRMWELCVEIRANVDYHLELSDTLAYNARRRAREEETVGVEEQSTSEQSERTDDAVSQEPLIAECNVALDFLDLLTAKGRKSMINRLLTLSGASSVPRGEDATCGTIECTLSKLKTTKGEKSSEGGLFSYESEKVVVVFSVIIMHILTTRNQLVTSEEIATKRQRPWLRHLFWEGVISYALWDCIPLLERKGLYELACSCLEVLLFGKIQSRDNLFSTSATADNTWNFDSMSLPELLLSRRTRGKAFERLMIDYKHLFQWEAKAKLTSFDDSLEESDESLTVPRGTGSSKTGDKGTATQKSPQEFVRRLCRQMLGSVARTGSIPFSAVRALARRLKAPLCASLSGLLCPESETLGIRLGNDCSLVMSNTTSKSDVENPTDGYTDWIPTTDFAVANAMTNDDTTLVGKRCSYVGFEDLSEKADISSFNVEELAMQYYATGRLPATEIPHGELLGGGWAGYHDEGGHVRALFRIICSSPILGMDSGCGQGCVSPMESLEQRTIHLTPYQGAPFDLHVAHRSLSSSGDEIDSDVRSFYKRRRGKIDQFLTKLENINSQELGDLVYDSIVGQINQGSFRNAVVARDLKQVRTLSMLAVGFGGRVLSAMFRSLMFDYRHYSGGLPDLLLVRALTFDDTDAEAATESKEGAVVDLGDWIGEEFHPEAKAEKEAASRSGLLIDKDDEFLGCNKVGDSRGQSSGGRWKQKRGGSRQKQDTTAEKSEEACPEKLPPRLVLRHNDKNVKVQCLFVEVKSQNDRLDGRQEDWLNIIDNAGGYARVCKFVGKPKKRSKEKAETNSKNA